VSLQLLGIFGAGMVTIVTPCVLPLVPIYLALLLGGVGAEVTSWRDRLGLLLATLAFSAGMILVFVAMGLTATSVGRLLTAHRAELTVAGGLLIFLFGLKLVGALRVGWLDRERRLDGSFNTRLRWLNAFIMGAVFSIGWTPCVGPILGSVLTYTASTTSSPWRGALYLAVYGAGLAAPLIVLALFVDSARRVIRRVSPWLPRFERATGVLLLVVGLVLMLDVSRPPPATLTPAAGPPALAAIDPPLGAPTARPRMVQFTTPSCSICRQMIPTVALIEHECGGRNVDVVKVDLGQPGNRALAESYQVRGVPTFLFLDRDGSVAARLVGHQTLGAMRQSLAALVGEKCAGIGLYKPDEWFPSTPTGSRCEQGAAAGKKCGT
jgi:cytochrome c-type biogenesis protein